MGTFAFILPTSSAVTYTIENNSLVTESGTYNFHCVHEGNGSLQQFFSDIKETAWGERGPFLIVYGSEQSGIAAAILEKLLEKAGSQDLEVSVDEIEWNEYIELDQSGYHLVSDASAPTLSSQCVDTLNMPMKGGIRVTQVGQLPFIVELNLQPGATLDLHTDLVIQVLEALVAGADYVPYRNTAVTKLLWRSLSGCSETLSSLFLFSLEDLTEGSNTKVLLKLADLLTKLHDLRTSGRSPSYIVPSPGTSLESIASSELKVQALKDEVRVAVNQVVSIYRQEAERMEQETKRCRREAEIKASRAMNALIRSKHDEINAAKRELRQLELAKFIVSQRHELADLIDDSPGILQENWFDGEIKRREGLLAELLSQGEHLRIAIDDESELQLCEPLLSLARQAEHNRRWLSRETPVNVLHARPDQTTLNVS